MNVWGDIKKKQWVKLNWGSIDLKCDAFDFGVHTIKLTATLM